MTNTVLIDTSYIFHRVTATSAYCKKANKEFCHTSILTNFNSSISKLSKKLNVDISNMILCRDSRPIWRDKFYDKYKAGRKYSIFGPYIKELYKNIESFFKVIIRIEEAEADDIISILCFFYLKSNPKNNIYIISNDKDFYQLPSLMKTKRIHILDNNKFSEMDTSNFDLESKIINGDRSDNIKKLPRDFTELEYLKNKQLIDLSYTPRYIQNKIFETGYFPLNQNVKPLKIQLGFACINSQLREKDIFCSRTTRLKTFQNKGLEYVKDLIRKNIRDLKTHVEWNYENGIRFMRMSSEMMPHYSNPKSESYTYDFVLKDLENIGRLARLYKQRLTFHPGQFNVLSTKTESVFISTRDELKWHADVLDSMGMDQNSVCIVHGGGLYGDKPSAIKRFISNFHRLDENIKRRLVIENCESCYNIEDMLYISSQTGAPVVFDTHHYNCYNLSKSRMKEAKEYIPEILETWKRRNIKPKFHISEQKPNARLGSHSDYVECIPEYLLEIPEKYGVEIDIMIEAKAKQEAVFHLYKKYPQLSPY